MKVGDLIKELAQFDPQSIVYMRDAHHFTRVHGLDRVEEEFTNQPYTVVMLVAEEVSLRDR